MARPDKTDYRLRQLRKVKPWQIATGFAASGLVSVFLLRNNNLEMANLREQLRSADKSGDNVQGALVDLQQYVLHHMNTSLATESVYPPIQLQHTYERLLQAKKSNADKSNTQLYINAKNHCEALNSTDVYGYYRVPCIEQYLQNHSTVKTKPIPTSLYKFDFVAPQWSPDLAGWSLVVTALIGIFLLVRLVAGWWQKKRTR